jgi:hypothetical protein
LNQLTDFHEIKQEGHAIEDYLDALIPFHSSAIPKWRTFKLLVWMRNLLQSTVGL